ncbi:STAS domain-containing protein [Umezawaea sp. Da 62-37]|uniref:STAS domain-containing protein n=1 Tax=Umezawaea sp. Da 62-37 TaxID=3075927 RepID=UPI0028F72426|nr:STAS domain-containing protein [Umezawaea sp. Da 62-37]WNV89120.1 STAS domain-containing protein [Umezawaea sp. Da 62-37]
MPTDIQGSLVVQRWRLAGATVISVSGEIDIATVRKLRWSLDSVASGSGPLILDLSSVSFFGSVGVNCLLETANRARAFRIDLRLIRSPQVSRVLELIGAHEDFAEFESLSSALAHSV